MQGTLLLAILTIRISYIRETEEALSDPSDVPDTLQWWISPDSVWRIRTYAVDHDIHTHEVTGIKSDVLQLAYKNNEKHYSDIIAAQHEINFVDCTDQSEVKKALAQVGLDPRLEVAAGRFAFWKPDDARYFTQSTPK